MRTLPEFCDPGNLVVPKISPEVRERLRAVSPDDLETLECLGIPATWGVGDIPVDEVVVTDRYADVKVMPERTPVGEAFVFMRSTRSQGKHHYGDYVIGRDGQVMYCALSSTETDCNYGTYTQFVVCVTALFQLARLDPDDWFEIRATLTGLNPNGFNSKNGYFAVIFDEADELDEFDRLWDDDEPFDDDDDG